MALSHDNFRFTFWCAVVPAVLAVLTLAWGVEEKVGKGKLSKGNPLAWDALKRLDKGYWLLFVVALIANLGNSSDAFLLLRSKQLGVPSHLVPVTMIVMNLVYAISAYPLGALSDRIGRFGLLSAGYILYAFVYAGFALATTPWPVWPLFGLYGICMGLNQGVLLAMVADRVTEEQRGTAFGFINLASGITLLPASLIAGGLWEHLSPAAPFWAGSFFTLMALMILVTGLKFATTTRRRP